MAGLTISVTQSDHTGRSDHESLTGQVTAGGHVPGLRLPQQRSVFPWSEPCPAFSCIQGNTPLECPSDSLFLHLEGTTASTRPRGHRTPCCYPVLHTPSVCCERQLRTALYPPRGTCVPTSPLIQSLPRPCFAVPRLLVLQPVAFRHPRGPPLTLTRKSSRKTYSPVRLRSYSLAHVIGVAPINS